MVLPWIRTSWTWRCSTARTKSEYENRVARRPGRSALEDAVEQRQQQHDDNPQGGVTVERVHGVFKQEDRTL